MTEGILNSLLVRVVPALFAGLMRVWFATCKVRVHNPENLPDPEVTGQPLVATFWHYSIIYFFYFMRGRRATAVVSASRDGEYIARLAGRFGFAVVRGSRNRKGVEALKGMLRAVAGGSSVAVVADGSQGPPRLAQPGAILVASRSGARVLPMAWSASRYFTIRSWDRTVIPKPFATIDYYYGEPISIPAGLDGEGIEQYRGLLESQLNELYLRAWSQWQKTEH
jgi:hypothetical protein